MMNISSATRCEPGYLNSNCLTSLALLDLVVTGGVGDTLRQCSPDVAKAEAFDRAPAVRGEPRDQCGSGKALRVLGHAEFFEPIGDLLHGAKPTRPSLR